MSPVSRPGRFLLSELGLTFRRRRNAALLAVLGLVPVVIAFAVRVDGTDARAGSIFGSITENGLFAALSAFLAATPLFLPLVVAVVAGDTVAGEANTGTLRYLLAVPVGRTRLLAVKFGAVVVWCVACVAVVTVLGIVAGLALFPSGDVVLLSGRTVAFSDALGRLGLAAGYIAAMLVVIGALGLFVSTMTEVPVAAMAATVTLTVASQVADAVPQLARIHSWLPSHYWTQWVDLLRDPIRTEDMHTGLLVALTYTLIFVSAAWANFSGRDITS